VIDDLRRRIVELLTGEDGYEAPLLDKVIREAKGALTSSPHPPHGRVFAPQTIEVEMRPADVSAFLDAIGTDDPTAYVRDRLNEDVRDVIFPDDFQVLLLDSDRVPPGRPRSMTKPPGLELTPFLASMSDGLLAPRSRRLPLGPKTVITRERLSSIVSADMEISSKRHAVITIVSRRRVEIRPVPNRYTAVDGTPLTEREVLHYRERGYRLTFGGRQLLLFWAEQLRSVPAGDQT
jgi:hypothetical protein